MTTMRSLSTQAKIIPIEFISSARQQSAATSLSQQQELSIKQQEPPIKKQEPSIKQQEPSIKQQEPSVKQQEPSIATSRPKRKLALLASSTHKRTRIEEDVDEDKGSEEGLDDDEYYGEGITDDEEDVGSETDNDSAHYDREDGAQEENPHGLKMVTTMGGKRYICSFANCIYSARRPSRLIEHENTHRGIRPFVCDQSQTDQFCGRSFFRRSHLNHHVKSLHDKDRRYLCTHEGCGKRFTTKQHLTRHEQTHENGGKGNIICREEGCGEHFRKRTQLERHNREFHQGLKPHVCNWENSDGVKCGLDFSSKTKLNTHKSREHRVTGVYICDSCPAPEGSEMEWSANQEFSQPGYPQPQRPLQQLAEHIPTEEIIYTTNPMNPLLDPSPSQYIVTSNVPLTTQPAFSTASSQTARLSFRNFTDFMEHIRECHPPKCTVCFKSFDTDAELRHHHEIKHIPLEARLKIPCDRAGCNALFTRKSNLRTHIKTVHDNVRPFSCKFCNEDFGHKAVMTRHIQTKHPESGVVAPVKKTPKKRERLTKQLDVVQLLTGTGYEESGRHIQCAFKDDGCAYRFARAIDLANHLASKEHGLSQVDAMNMVEDMGHGRVFMKGVGRVEDESVLERNDDEQIIGMSQTLTPPLSSKS